MTRYNPKQRYLISPEDVFGLKPLRKYELLFETLEPSLTGCFTSKTRGRSPVSKPALLNALIYKNLKQLPTLFDLASSLVDNPRLATTCGLLPNKSLNSLVERLSSFLRDTPNSLMQSIRINLVNQLIQIKEISGHFLSIDSAPVPIVVRENNLKTSMKDRFNKTKPPKRDPEARLGVMIHFINPFQKEPQYFWGYRNHSIADCDSELPVWELTKPANVQDTTLFIPLFNKILDHFNFEIQGVMADAAYDSENNLKFVIDDLHALPRIARNLRWEKLRDVNLSSKGGRICIAGFEMIYWGKFKDRGKIRKKFVCPITHSKKFARQVPTCPWNHPAFQKGKGCTAYLRGDKDVRKDIDYGSYVFKEHYNKRTSSERVFSRLLTLCMQTPRVYGLNAISNHCTIAHITVLVIALTATKMGQRDKLRFVKKFLLNL
ncbi:MAG: transposase [Deltaproteobacteria bacterium]|nr:transposase [Deltaproteobacteria bacterium]